MSDEPLEYEVVNHWSVADDRFIAEVPELPGCVADGPTPRQALKNAEFVASDWIETVVEPGRPVPQPRGRLLLA